MSNIITKASKGAFKKLTRIEKSVDKIVKKGAKNISKGGHAKLRKLIKRRAKVLSKITGAKIRSIFD